MSNTKLSCIALSAILLSGCGSDDSSATTVPVEKPIAEKITPNAKYIAAGPTRFVEPFDGKIEYHLGKFDDKINAWLDPFDPSKDLNKDKMVNSFDAKLAGIVNTLEHGYEVDIEEMKKVLETNPDGLGAGTSRPDIYATVATLYSTYCDT